MLSYVNNQSKMLENDMPVLGHYNVNRHGSTDMYYKGSLMLHVLANTCQ